MENADIFECVLSKLMPTHEECIKYNFVAPLNVWPTNYAECNMNLNVKDFMKLIFSSLYEKKRFKEKYYLFLFSFR